MSKIIEFNGHYYQTTTKEPIKKGNWYLEVITEGSYFEDNFKEVGYVLKQADDDLTGLFFREYYKKILASTKSLLVKKCDTFCITSYGGKDCPHCSYVPTLHIKTK